MVSLTPTEDMLLVLMLSIVSIYVHFRVQVLTMLHIVKPSLLSLLPSCDPGEGGPLSATVALRTSSSRVNNMLPVLMRQLSSVGWYLGLSFPFSCLYFWLWELNLEPWACWGSALPLLTPWAPHVRVSVSFIYHCTRQLSKGLDIRETWNNI